MLSAKASAVTNDGVAVVYRRGDSVAYICGSDEAKGMKLANGALSKLLRNRELTACINEARNLIMMKLLVLAMINKALNPNMNTGARILV
jgi:hypothetical protein